MFQLVFHLEGWCTTLSPTLLIILLERVQHLLHRVEDHLARHAIDRALPDRLLEPRLRHPADALTTCEIQPPVRRHKRAGRHPLTDLNIRADLRAVRNIRIIPGILSGREAAIRRRIHRQRHPLIKRSRVTFRGSHPLFRRLRVTFRGSRLLQR